VLLLWCRAPHNLRLSLLLLMPRRPLPFFDVLLLSLAWPARMHTRESTRFSLSLGLTTASFFNSLSFGHEKSPCALFFCVALCYQTEWKHIACRVYVYFIFPPCYQFSAYCLVTSMMSPFFNVSISRSYLSGSVAKSRKALTIFIEMARRCAEVCSCVCVCLSVSARGDWLGSKPRAGRGLRGDVVCVFFVECLMSLCVSLFLVVRIACVFDSVSCWWLCCA